MPVALPVGREGAAQPAFKATPLGADLMRVYRRYNRLGLLSLLAFTAVAALVAPSAAAKGSAAESWARPQIKAVVAHGLMAKSVASFKPATVMTEQELDEILPVLSFAEETDSDTTTEPTDTGTTTGPGPTDPEHDPGATTTTTSPTTTTTTTTTTPTTTTSPTTTTTTTTTATTTTATTTTTTTPTTTTTTPNGKIPGLPREGTPLTVSQFDTSVVRAIGLGDAANRFRKAASQAGLSPPKRYGTEIVARLLGLRINHPASEESLELLPNQPITRAEAAYSIAQVLSLDGWETEAVREASADLELPAYTAWQKRVLGYAVGFIGYPYIWGGTSPKAQRLFGRTVPGGFDCSGFVWQVYKLHKYPGEGDLSSVIQGRTTYVMSGEVGRAKRIGLKALQPADVLFFGAKGTHSKPSQINHTAIYLGDGWLIQSSGNGVDIVPMAGWYQSRFAWARRPLAEAGLADVYSVSGS
jgi:cell wall-associated NlpC family hydrolase